MNEVVIDERERSNRTLTMVIYGLLALGPFTGLLTSIVAVVMNYVKLEDVRGTWIDSHFRWQLRTFWFSLLWCTLLTILIIVTFGFGIILAWPLGLALGIWYIYRLVKGFLNLNDGKPMYTAA